MSKGRADDLRAAFDRDFAQAPAGPPPATVDLLRIRVAGMPRALSLADIASLHVDLHVEPVPARAPALLGVATIRSQIVPVLDLRTLLGATGGGVPRWIAVARGGAAAVAFDGFDGLVRIVAGSIDKEYPVLDLGHVLRKEA